MFAAMWIAFFGLTIGAFEYAGWQINKAMNDPDRLDHG